jgi:competence protein ComEC
MRKAANFFVKYSALAILAAAILLWQIILAQNSSDKLMVAFLDIGQGDAIFIQAPGGTQVLIDGGPNNGILKELGRIMPFYDRSLDIIIATHPDLDHIGGLPRVIKNYSVNYILEPGVIRDTAAYQEFRRLSKAEGARLTIARRGQKIEIGQGAVLEILFPDRDVSNIEANTASIVAKLTYGQTSLLLTGDAPDSIEKYLASLDGLRLDVDVLKVGHHGSNTSTTDMLLGLSSPKYAVISAGRDNRYGHPHQEVLESLERFGAEILRTDTMGTVVLESDGHVFSIK